MVFNTNAVLPLTMEFSPCGTWKLVVGYLVNCDYASCNTVTYMYMYVCIQGDNVAIHVHDLHVGKTTRSI